MVPPDKYVHNQVPLKTRVFRLLGSLGLIAYGILGVVIDDIVIPGKRTAFHLHGLPAWLMALAMACAAIWLLALVIDHYDRRNNEAIYRAIEEWARKLGWILAGLATGLQIGGVHYPQPSTVTPTSAFFGGLFMLLVSCYGFLKIPSTSERQTSERQTNESESSTHAGLRKISGAITIAGGCFVIFIAWKGLFNFQIINYVAVAASIILICLGTILLSPLDKSPQSVVTHSPSFAHWKTIRITALLIFGLGAIWYVRAQQWGEWLEQDEQERRTAPLWTYHFEDFSDKLSRDQIQKKLVQEGFHVRCYGNLKADEQVEPDDKETCWTIARSTDGIPTRMITFWFGENGLKHIRMDFDRSDALEVQKWVDRQGTHLTYDFGREHGGSKIDGWRGKTGLILYAPPGALNWVMVFWQSHETAQKTYCSNIEPSTGHNYQDICLDWPVSHLTSKFIPQ